MQRGRTDPNPGALGRRTLRALDVPFLITAGLTLLSGARTILPGPLASRHTCERDGSPGVRRWKGLGGGRAAR
jgi:hypothetical protein